jgi:type IV secretory pathway VirB10-like protein
VSELDDKIDPEGLALRAKPRPVARINRRTFAVLIAVSGVVVLLATWWGLRPQGPRPPDATASSQAPQAVTRAEGLSNLPSDYDSWRPIPKLGPPTGELGRPVLRAEHEAGIDSYGANGFRPSPDVDAQRVARLRLQDEAEAAAKAQVFFQTRHSIGQVINERAKSRSADLNDLAKPGADFRGVEPTRDEEGSDQPHKNSFLEKKADPAVYASGILQEPNSPYQLMAGTIVAAALVTGINSDLPGQAIASVTQNVYDTVSGTYLLIPQGARLLGQYDSQVAYGQRRVLLVWTRLIMPDGSSITLDRLKASDPAGYAGLEDQVDWHWNRVFAGAAVSTLLGINSELAAPDRGLNSGSLIVASRQSAQDTINQIGQQLTRRNLSIQPTLSIRPGFALRIIVNKDLILRPYGQSLDLEQHS